MQGLAKADDDRAITVDQLPQKAQEFIQKYFPKNEISLAKMEKDFWEKKYEVVVITQNVDTLHEQAGSTNVIHLHGNLNEVRTVDDDNLIFTYPYEGITPNTEIEGHKIRPHIVLFGEDVPMIGIAAEELTDADICVVVGTSFNVYPAAGLIQYVPYGSPIYYIDPNPAPTPEYPDIKVIKATATEGMKQLIKILEK